MESQKIELLLDRYFEGETTVAEEKSLQEYFLNDQVAPHLEVYRGMFAYFAEAKKETSGAEITLTKEPIRNPLIKRNNWYAVAALLVVSLGVAFFLNQSASGLSPQDQEAVIAYEKTKEALDFISIHLNEGAGNLEYLQEFESSTNKIFK